MRKAYTEEELMIESKRYTSIAEWQKINKSSYNAAWRMGILDKIKPFMKKIG
ncbi:MAG: hypothetical protein HC840_00955 [Leptolyngbyaceae cyanobacterium RM2_2_4]|nr:hypothetical protein [Leptolyngbyaceae cyanobacterium RM2_2_4]